MKRIRRLLGQDRPRAITVPLLGLLLVPACLALGVWHSMPSRAVALQIAQAPAPPPSPYQKWLQEDVAYIITPQEKEAYQRLQTDAERQQFIEQFWLRRDPTPGTPRNEFQEEHYRRIAYANDHFGFEDTAGWRTDRGRIYIQFGPPDERDVFEKGGTASNGKPILMPLERWRYRYIQGVGNGVFMEFVDAARTGNYQMTRDPAGPAAGGRFVPAPKPN